MIRLAIWLPPLGWVFSPTNNTTLVPITLVPREITLGLFSKLLCHNEISFSRGLDKQLPAASIWRRYLPSTSRPIYKGPALVPKTNLLGSLAQSGPRGYNTV